jgi:hypothetical protein
MLRANLFYNYNVLAPSKLLRVFIHLLSLSPCEGRIVCVAATEVVFSRIEYRSQLPDDGVM